MSLPIRMVLLAFLLLALVGFGIFVGDGEPRGKAKPATNARFRSSTQCAQCHRGVWNEWHGSHHQIAYENEEVRKLSDDFRNKECQACHLPRPVSVTGYARRTLHRTTLPAEGVSCLTCHLGVDGEILGRRSVPSAPCQPIASTAVTSVALCESCHNQHNTTDQWRATDFAKAGTDCNACHMPVVERTGGRRGRGHAYHGSHDIDTLRRAVKFAVRAEGEQLVVRVENAAAGHNFPTAERSRAADVVVRFDRSGDWQRLHRFRLPYRSEPLTDTTLPHGKIEELRIAVPGGAKSATARLWYRLTPFVADADPLSALLFEQEVDLVTGTPRDLVLPELPAVSAFRPVPEPIVIPTPTPLADAAPDARAAGAHALPPLPTIALEPKLAKFRALAAAAQPPNEARMRQLRDLLTTAFEPGLGTRRVAAMAKRSLLSSDDAVWALEDALGHDSGTVRANAAFELGRLGEPSATVALALRLKREADLPEPTALPWVAEALSTLGNQSGLPYLISLMAKPSTRAVAGSRAVEICRTENLDLGTEPTWERVENGLRTLHRRWQERAEPTEVSERLRSGMAAHLVSLEDFQLRGVDEARFVLEHLGMAPVTLLREALHAEEPYLRTHVLEIVRELGRMAAAAAPDVLPLLGDPLTCADAARALGAIGAVRAQPHLLALLQSANLELRAAAAGALGGIGSEDARVPLRKLFDDERQPLDVRVRAAFALARIDSASTESSDPGRKFLEDLSSRGAYHAPTLKEMLERLDVTKQK